jgi:spore maturation protein CgeB
MVQKPSKVLIVQPSRGEVGYGSFLARGLRANGSDVRQFTLWQARERPSPIERLAARAVQAVGARGVLVDQRSRTLLKDAASFRPDVVIVVKGLEIPSAVLHGLRGAGSRLVNILTDSPVVYPGVGDRARLDALGAYDLVVTFGRSFIPVLYQMGAGRVERLPFAYDPELHYPRQLTPEDKRQYASPVAYMGCWGPLQERWLPAVIPFGLRIYGIGWGHLPLGHPLRACIGQAGWGEEFPKACAGAGLVVNFIRAEHNCGHSMKTFEVPACGAVHFVNRTEEQLEFFAEEEGTLYFDTPEELLEKVRFGLSHPGWLEAVRTKGIEKVKPHTYSSRARDLLRLCE